MGSSTRNVLMWIALGIVVILLLTVGFMWNQHRQQQRVAEFAASAKLMALTQASAPAPSIDLVDQNGKRVRLSDFRGKLVVLEFMDPVCTDICPIVSQEFIQADKLLGNRARDVVFVAVNVNQYHESVADVKKFSEQHGLSTLNNWYFLTGTTPALQKAWKDYDIYVQPNPTGDVVHSSVMYFIDRNGNERAIASPTNKQNQISAFAKGIALVTEQMA